MAVEKMRNDYQYRFCHNQHAYKLTLILCPIGILFYIAYMIASIIQLDYAQLIANVFCLIPFILLLIGNRRAIRLLYWPFFIYAILIIGLFSFVILSLLGLVIDSFVNPDPQTSSHDKTNGILVLLGQSAGMVAIDGVHIFVFFVVFRDFDYINAVLLNPESTLPRV